MFKKIYRIVQKIPRGSVMTYGEVGSLAGTTGRVVGFALHANPDEKNIPCHRVVDRNGRLAPHFAFGGSREQYLRLQAEGVVFLDNDHVRLI